MIAALIIFALLGAVETGELNKGLVGHWPLDNQHQASTTVGRDLSTQGNELTSLGTPSTFASDGIDLNGTTDYLKKSVSGFQSSDQFGTVCGWANFDSFTTTPSLFGVADEGATNDFLIVGADTSARLYITVRTGGTTNRMESTATLSADTWYHLCVSSNGSRFLLFINSDSVSFGIGAGTNNGAWLADLVATTDNVTIGARELTSVSLHMNGELFDVRYYDREVSTTAIGYLYNQGRRIVGLETGSLYQGLVASWYPTTSYQGSATTIRDLTPYGQEMVSIAGGTIGTTGITLNGSTQYLDYQGADAADWRSTDETGAVACWVNLASLTAASACFGTGDEAGTTKMLYLRVDTDGLPDAIVRTGAGNNLIETTSCTAGTVGTGAWHLVTFDSDYEITLDGQSCVESKTIGATDGDWLADIAAGRDNVTLGVIEVTVLSQPLTGTLGQVLYWDWVLTDAEYGYHYDQGRRVVEVETGSLYKGLEGRWILDNEHLASSTDARDSTPNSNDLAGIDTPSFGSDGVTLNGTSEYLEKNVAFRNSDQQGTICAWVYITDFSTAPAVFSVANSGNTTDYMALNLDTNRTVRHITRIGGTTNRVITTATLSLSTWHHVCSSSNGSRFKVWIDGSDSTIVLDQGTDAGQWIGDLGTATDRLTIGRLSRLGPILYLAGTVFDVRYYSRELSATEIGYLYSYGPRP